MLAKECECVLAFSPSMNQADRTDSRLPTVLGQHIQPPLFQSGSLPAIPRKEGDN